MDNNVTVVCYDRLYIEMVCTKKQRKGGYPHEKKIITVFAKRNWILHRCFL